MMYKSLVFFSKYSLPAKVSLHTMFIPPGMCGHSPSVPREPVLLPGLIRKIMRMGRTYCEVPGYFQIGTKPSKGVSFRNGIRAAQSYFAVDFKGAYQEGVQLRQDAATVYNNLAPPVVRGNSEYPVRDSPNDRKTARGDWAGY